MGDLKEMTNKKSHEEQMPGNNMIPGEATKSTICSSASISPDEKLIMEKMRSTLNKHGYIHIYNPATPRRIELNFNIQNKPMRLFIYLKSGAIQMRLQFPFAVLSNAIAMVALYMADFNEKKSLAHMTMDTNEGSIMMEHMILLKDPALYEEDDFWRIVVSHVRPAMEIYHKLSYMALGIVKNEERFLYRELLKQALDTLEGEFDPNIVEYGSSGTSKRIKEEVTSLYSIEDILTGKDTSFATRDSEMAKVVLGLRNKGIPELKKALDRDKEEEDAKHLEMFSRTDAESI